MNYKVSDQINNDVLAALAAFVKDNGGEIVWPRDSLVITTIATGAFAKSLAEHPIGPTEEQTEALYEYWLVFDDGHKPSLAATCVEWPRRMFIAPEPPVPPNIKDLLTRFDGTGIDNVAHEAIIEAERRGFDRGREAK